MINLDFKSVIELVKTFKDEQICIDHLEQLRWNGNVISPFDPESKVYKCAGNKYRCKNTGKYFNVRTSTLFDNTKVELQTWFIAIYLVTSHKKGISSIQLGKDLNVTQKTAWFMLQRIRNCFGIIDENNEGGKLGGGGQIVEIDETYVGGKIANMHKSKRDKMKSKAGTTAKTMVMGYLVRGGEVRLTVQSDQKDIFNSAMENVASDSVIMTDMHHAYKRANEFFMGHEKVDHSLGEYSRDGIIYTNGIEGVFSIFDRMVIGTYHSLSKKHMQKYANEVSFRYNTRKISESERFRLLLENSDNRITYQNLIK